MASTKALPSSLRQFEAATEAHQQFASSSQLHPTSSFRAPTDIIGGDEDFGRFANSAYTSVRTELSDQFSGIWSNEPSLGDGNDVLALLRSTNVTEEVFGAWEEELREDQSRWDYSLAIKPLDPTSTQLSQSKDKDTEEVEAIISGLSSLELSDRNYLQSLVALSEHVALSDYLSQVSYSEDVWSLTEPVQRLLDTATKAQEGQTVEEGHKRALRRLEGIMKQLWGPSTTAKSTRPTNLAPNFMHEQAQMERSQMNQEYMMASQHTIRRTPPAPISDQSTSTSYMDRGGLNYALGGVAHSVVDENTPRREGERLI